MSKFLIKNEKKTTFFESFRYTWQHIGSSIVGQILECLNLCWDLIYFCYFITGGIPHWPELLHPYSELFKNIHLVRLWSAIMVLGWLRLIIFGKLTHHIYTDLDQRTRMAVRVDGVFRISCSRMLIQLILYEIPITLLQRFLVEKYVIFKVQIWKLIIQCFFYIFATCHFMSLKKFKLPSKTWRHHQSYYILACVPILCSSLILFRIALINANIKFSSCIKLDVSRQGIRTASSFIQASCYSDAEIILVVFCCIFVLFIILSWIVYLTKRGHFLERIKTIRTRMWLGYPKHVDEIHTAIFQYNSEKVETLLTHRKSILDSKTENGDTCLILAIKTKNYEMVKTLIDAGCDRKVCDKAGKSPLFYAMRSKNAQILELVNGNNIDSTITKGIFHAELDSFNKRIEHRVSKNVYNIRRVSKEFHRAENRRSGSFHDIIFDCQKRGVVKDDFDIIKALTNIDSEMCSNRLSTESGVYNQIGAEPLTVMPTITDEFDEVGDNLLDLSIPRFIDISSFEISDTVVDGIESNQETIRNNKEDFLIEGVGTPIKFVDENMVENIFEINEEIMTFEERRLWELNQIDPYETEQFPRF